MTEELEPNEQDRAVIKAPKLSCDATEAKTILDEIGMGKLSTKDDDAASPELRAPTLNDLLKLGAFVEGSGVVPLDHGAILMTRQVMLRQMLRLEEKAQNLATFADIKDITYAIGFLGDKIGKISTIGIKTKVAAEEAAEELRKKKQPSWEAGAGVGGAPVTAVQAQAGSTVHLHAAPNGVAATPPVA
jgi:hypothetical protein